MTKIIATVGPSLLKTTKLDVVHNNRNIYRINGAHGEIEEIEKLILKIKSQLADAKILMDLPGNKIRTSNLPNGYINIEKDKEFSIDFSQTNYIDFYKHLRLGDEVWANDSMFHFVVTKIDYDLKKIYFLSNSDGSFLNNKGMHVRGIHAEIPFLFDKDINLINLANKYQLDYVGLSFVRNANDIKKAKKYIEHSEVISKVETKSAIKNLNQILDEVDFILVDRGDLSSEVGLSKIPRIQELIVERSTLRNKKVFLATQFLKTMEYNSVPTIAEVVDIYNTLKTGIYGIQLSEETAIGKFPKECINIILEIINEIEEIKNI